MNRQRGFTLIEILIVVGMIGLLGSLAAIAVLKAMKTTKIKKAEAELAMINSAITTLADATGRWPNKAVRTTPGSIEIWDLSAKSAGLLDSDGSYPNWNGPYCDDVMTDPWGNPYFFDPAYTVNGQSRIVVGSFGPNGRGRNEYDDDDIYILLDD
ncbi:MAG: type II secretion system protein GspG [Pontiellaceae bacterium]|nr:type II secretion system protein GspG [Pontiellaceae bacterium]